MPAKIMALIRGSDAPVEKESVFSRATDAFGIEGPATCHPFVRKYDIVTAAYLSVLDNADMDFKQHRFVVAADPNNVDSTTPAIMRDCRFLAENISPSDRLRLEVISSSLSLLQV